MKWLKLRLLKYLNDRIKYFKLKRLRWYNLYFKEIKITFKLLLYISFCFVVRIERKWYWFLFRVWCSLSLLKQWHMQKQETKQAVNHQSLFACLFLIVLFFGRSLFLIVRCYNLSFKSFIYFLVHAK